MKKRKTPLHNQIGNKNAVKLKKPDVRQKAFEDYLSWISNGKPVESWYYDDGQHTCGYLTMRRYIRENPDEFSEEKVKIAEAKRYNLFLDWGLKMMMGEIKQCQPVIFQMFMRNMFGWDKQEKNSSEAYRPLVEKLLEHWEKE